MPRDSAQRRFLVAGETLTVRGELGRSDSDDFSKRLRELLESGVPAPRVDLTRVETITSSCVRPLMDAASEAKEQDRRITVRARPEIAFMLDVAGLASLADIETV